MIFEGFASKDKIKQNPRKSSSSFFYRFLIDFASKTMKIQDVGKFSCFNQAKRWFFDYFSIIFEGFASKEKIKQNLGNHQKIIVLLEKTKKTCQNLEFSWFFNQNDYFLMICLMVS